MISILEGIIIGIITYIVFIPVIESLASLIVQLLEVAKGWLIVALAKAQQAAKYYHDTPKTSTHVIGFSVSNEEDYEEDEDDE